MARRQYVKGLAAQAKRMNVYIAKHQTTINGALAVAGKTQLQSCVACLQALLAELEAEQPGITGPEQR